MKRILVLLVGVVSVLLMNGGEIVKVYSFDSPKVETVGDYQILKLENALNSGLAGEPSLPFYAVQILLPPGQKAVSIEFVGFDEAKIIIDQQILPYQTSKPISETKSFDFEKNNKVYSSNALYPQKSTGELITQYLNGYAFALSSFTPVKYNPSTGELITYRKVKIRIVTEDCETSEKALSNLNSSEQILSKVKAFAQNQEMISRYPLQYSRSTDYDVLVITDSQFEHSFDDLLNLYQMCGLTPNIVSTSTIGSEMTGQDMPEKIRNYIIQEYQENGVGYVLLGGDIEHMPYRGLYGFVDCGDGYEDDGIPSDLYYSALDGNWNTDEDIFWGEAGEDDLLPEISVGRFSFSNTEELENMIHKTVSYQTNPVTGELTDALFAGEWAMDDPDTWGSDYLELLIGHRTDNGYETWGIPETYNFTKLYASESYWEAPQLLAAINQGSQFIHHFGHANFDYWAFFYNDDITNENFSEVNGVDHNYAIVLSHGCICGSFDTNDCIMERMVCIDNFAVACIANSRYGWFNEGQTEGPSVHLHREMVDAIYHEELYRIGDAFVECKIQTAPWVTMPGQWEEGALRWNFYDANILGDPCLPIWTNEPYNLNTTYENTLELDALSTDVNVSINSLPAENLTCVFIKEGIVYGTGVTDVDGNLTIVFTEAFPSIGLAKIVVSGNNCIPTEYPISIVLDASLPMIVENKISVYPSLAKDFITITTPAEYLGLDYCIYNSVGQIVSNHTLKEENANIDVSKFRSGKYFIEFIGVEESSRHVFIKQ